MIDELRRIVGDKGLITDPADMSPWLTDWRQRRRGEALAVVEPASTLEVSAVVSLCARNGQPVFPVGGNTGLCFGAVPESTDSSKPGIVLSLRRMNNIRSIDRATGVAIVDAGVVLANLHGAAADAGRQFPLHLGSEGSAMVGGLISTNAGGTGVVRYGPMRDLVAGIEVVLADGRILSDLAALRKDNTGYMLRQMFVGAEGTLGIITGAALRLHPQTANTAHAWVAATTPDAAIALLAALQDRAGSYVHAVELVSKSQFEVVRRYAERARFPFADIPEWSVLIELGSEDSSTALSSILEEVLGEALEEGAVVDAAVATSEQQAAEFWHVRHSVSETNRHHGIGLSHDISVRSSDVGRLIAQADAIVAKHYPQAEPQVVCHLGDGNVHYVVMFPKEYWNSLPDAGAFALGLQKRVHDVAVSLGGTFSAEHGVGRKLTMELERLGDPLRYELMKKIKALFDPQNIMNPGVLFSAPRK